MKVELKQAEYQQTIFGAGICVVPTKGAKCFGMAVKAGIEKKIVRVMGARKWLVEHGCSKDLAKDLVSRALNSKNLGKIYPHLG